MTDEVTSELSGIKVRMKHIRQANLCWDGTRDWFDYHELNWRDLRKSGPGVPVEYLERTGDKMALDVARFAREDAEQ